MYVYNIMNILYENLRENFFEIFFLEFFFSKFKPETTWHA